MANEKRLIDANVLIETGEEGYITDIFPNWNGFPQSVQNAVCEYGRYIKNLIQEQPTVDAVEVVHAKWENVQNGKGCCSNCHRLDGIDPLATYCRYCGAKMDGDGNG